MDCAAEEVPPMDWLILQAENWSVNRRSPSPEPPRYNQYGYDIDEAIWFSGRWPPNNETNNGNNTGCTERTDLLERMLSGALDEPNPESAPATPQPNPESPPDPTAIAVPSSNNNNDSPNIVPTSVTRPRQQQSHCDPPENPQRQVSMTEIPAAPGWNHRDLWVADQNDESDEDTPNSSVANDNDEIEDEEMMAPPVLQRIVNAMHRALLPLEAAIDRVARDYVENGQRLLLAMSAGEDQEEERVRHELRQRLIPALLEGEQEMAGLLEELREANEPIQGLHKLMAGGPEAWEKLRAFCAEAERELEAAEDACASPEVITGGELSPQGQELVRAFQARILEQVRAGREPQAASDEE